MEEKKDILTDVVTMILNDLQELKEEKDKASERLPIEAMALNSIANALKEKE